MIPKTADGRVLFAIPWHGATIVGTTDIPVDQVDAEPRALSSERKFLLNHIARYFKRAPKSHRDTQCLVRPSPPGAQRPRQILEVIQRSYNSGFALRTDYGDRRQVDDLPAHGPGYD